MTFLVGGLSANKQLSTESSLPPMAQPSAPSIAPRKPLMTNQPMPMSQMAMPSIAPRKALNTEPVIMPVCYYIVVFGKMSEQHCSMQARNLRLTDLNLSVVPTILSDLSKLQSFAEETASYWISACEH